MAASTTDTQRFRSATDFPQQIQTLEREQANALYAEMRECLIFTNRSRAQLVRRNTEHKDKTLQLRDKIGNLQGLINQLQTQKQTQLAEREAIITQLAGEMQEMDAQLNTLSQAFDAVGDVESEAQSQWGRLLFPKRILSLLKAVKALMQWYKKDETPEITGGAIEIEVIDEEHRRDYPHQYTDQASINRDLLDR
ncbi:MAG: Baculovirus polyhedron envelope protein, PEP, C terminus [Phormidesmis priestleyi Ana]|uniref:Baculovirus polyhedron envelope protein, PEP, C terminus n=1 Tax=Phormidesmis priestleyi Ana TaxID=1666911 RepID=A0A0P7ZQM9_9CYAN|nr:MAG: Baculovirus polyhedron envelope protein, PEP, C terminus [Phormidesmis priestleyi Ana]